MFCFFVFFSPPCLQFLPASSEPGQLLRASTKKVGTDSYRAPEVDSGEEYDPSAADVWSLGVTLFFMVKKSDLRVYEQHT